MLWNVLRWLGATFSLFVSATGLPVTNTTRQGAYRPQGVLGNTSTATHEVLARRNKQFPKRRLSVPSSDKRLGKRAHDARRPDENSTVEPEPELIPIIPQAQTMGPFRSEVVVRWREKGNRTNSYGKSEEWIAAWLYVAASVAYIGACAIYDKFVLPRGSVENLQHDQGQQRQRSPVQLAAPPKSTKSRMQNWDFMRLALQVMVIANHTDNLLYRNVGPTAAIFQAWPSSFKMNGFIFISGVFGSSMEWNSVSKMLCYTLGTGAFLNAMVYIVNALPDPFKDFQEQAPVTTWYLVVLLGCRLTVSPLFYWCRNIRVPTVIPLIGTVLACYAMRPLTGTWSDDATLAVNMAKFMGNQFTFFAPFFALGLCLPVSRWNTLMQESWVYFFSIVFTACWFGGLVCCESFAQWADSACTRPGQCTVTTHYPDAVLPPYVLGLASLYSFVRVFCQRALIGCTTLCVIGNAVQPLSRILPMDNICALGSRTIYGYVLHWPIFIILGLKMHLELLFYAIPQKLWPLACFAVSVLNALTFSCRLTERLFRWMVLPYWLLDIADLVLPLKAEGPTKDIG